MKIRKANVFDERKTTNIYIYENKKEEYVVVSIPDIEWSCLIRYEEETAPLRERLAASLSKNGSLQQAEPLAEKLLYWIREM